jgi:hypothetical protein
MLKKYISKFTMDILPSVAATIIGAYIVNHYIVTKPGANAPVAAAVSSTEPKAEAKVAPDGAKAAETSADVANIPEPGVKARGISERSVLEKSAIEKPAEKSADKAEKPADKAEKPADKPAETASIPVETRRHRPAPREKAIAKAVPAPVQPSAPVAAPVVAAPTTAPAVEAAIAPEEHRDANDLARAAIERLRGASDGSPRAQEAARVPDTPRVVAAPVGLAPVVAAPPVRPLPPPIMVSTPTPETFNSAAGSSEIRSSYPAAAGIEDPRRPTPPADIPSPPSPASRPPLDLHADAREPPPREHTTVAEDVLSAAKSVFHAVLPR